MTDKLITTAEAARILDRTPQNVRFHLDFDKQVLFGNKPHNYYYLSKIIALKEKSAKRKHVATHNRVRRYKKQKKVDRLDDPHGVMLSTEVVYRGRICLFKGCKNPVGTGQAVCEKHRAWYQQRQEACSYLEESVCSI